MSQELRSIVVNAVIVLGGGWLLSSMNFLPWFAVGVPLVIVLSLRKVAAKEKPATYRERHEAMFNPAQ